MPVAPLPLQQRGMSLAELMISVTIGLLITLAISTLFMDTNRSNKENSDITLMQENARFAMELIAGDIRHAGFFGNVQNPGDIDLNGVTMPDGTDCGGTVGTPYMLNFSSSQWLIGYDTGLTGSDVAALITPCTTAATLPAVNNTILAIKRVSSTSVPYNTFHTMTSGKESGRIFVHSNGSAAKLGSGNTEPYTQSSVQVWEYQPRYYYLSSTDTLYRSTYSIETAGEWLGEPIAEGIERFHLEYGIDSDDDGTPNYFSDVPADIDFDQVVSARVHVVARTTRIDANYEDTNTYRLGSIQYVPSADPDANKKRYHRQIYSMAVNIPNFRRQHTLN